MMDTDHPKPGDEPSVGTGGDWRTHLSPDARQTIINKITDTLAKHLPFSVEEGLEELKKLAARFEEKNYSAATSQSDYLKRISLKMVAMESKSQNTVSNSLQPNTTMPLDSRAAYHNMQPQVQIQGEPLPMAMLDNQSKAHQQKNSQSNMGSTVSLDSTEQIGHSNGGDWLEEVHQKIKALKEMYLPELTEMHQKVALRLQQHDSLRQPFTSEQLEVLKITKMMLELLTTYLQISKTNIPPGFRLESFEKQIMYYINFNKVKKSVLNMQQNNIAGMQHTKYAETSASSLDSTAENGNSSGVDWQEEIHQKIQAMKEMYLPELNEMYQEIASKLEMHASLPQQPKSEQLQNLKMSRPLVEYMIALLQVSKTNVPPSFKEKLGSYEECIIDCINAYRNSKSILPPLQQGQPNMVQNKMIDSTPKTGHSNGSYWQAEGYQKDEQVEKQKLLNNNRMDQSKSQGSIPTMQQKNHIEKQEGHVALQVQSHEKQMKPHIQRKRVRASVQRIWQTNYLLGVCAILLCLAYLSINHCKT